MLQMPTAYSLVSSSAEGETRLTAFDKALLLAGVGNCNLLKVSSILPPNAKYIDELVVPAGSLLPIAYAATISTAPGETICAGVAVGLGENESEYGVIMEYHSVGTKQEVIKILDSMIKEAFNYRGRELVSFHMAVVDHVVVRCGCVFAAIPLWYT